MEEKHDMRMKGGLPKVEQIRRTDAQWVVTACENCKTQLENLNERYELGIEIKDVIDLIADSLVLWLFRTRTSKISRMKELEICPIRKIRVLTERGEE